MPSTQYPITETFLSVQSEGSLAGQAAFFIRFGGCNLTCQFTPTLKCDEKLHCDSENNSMISSMELMILARKSKTHNIIITGGEPSLNGSVSKLIRYFRREGYHVSVETNGHKIERLLDANLITYSPKIGFSKGARQISYDEYLSFEHKGDIELKLLAGIDNTPDTGRWEDYPLKYLQAINHEDTINITNARYVSDFVATNPEWYTSFQAHKITKVR